MAKWKPVAGIKAAPKFQNGDVVRDRVTRLEGVVTATTIWLNGCIRYVIQPQEIKDGKPVDSTVIDEQQLELTRHGRPGDAEAIDGRRA